MISERSSQSFKSYQSLSTSSSKTQPVFSMKSPKELRTRILRRFSGIITSFKKKSLSTQKTIIENYSKRVFSRLFVLPFQEFEKLYSFLLGSLKWKIVLRELSPPKEISQPLFHPPRNSLASTMK